MKNLVFFGNEQLATGIHSSAPIFRSLVKNGYEIRALVLHNEPTKSRNTRTPEVVAEAEKNNIKIFYPRKLSEIEEDLKNLDAQAGILAAFGKIVPESTINLFPKGIINIHPSLLPLHRGSTPLESVILNGDAKTGVSIMQLAKEMDAGNVYGQSEIKLSSVETKQELADKLANLGEAMLSELLPGILDSSVIALPQDDQHATYDRLITKEDGVIDWRKPAERIEREIRAYLGWPQSRTTLGGQEVIVTKARVADVKLRPGELKIKNKSLIVGSADKAIEIIELKPAGKNKMSAEAFLAGYGKTLEN